MGPPGAGERPACYDAGTDRWFTYSELYRAVERCAARLALPQKALVFCFCENNIESLTGYLGCWMAGHAVLLLDARLDPGFRNSLFSIYRPDFVITPEAGIPGDLAADKGWVSVPSGGGAIWRAAVPVAREIHPDLAVLLSTSGSTGSPKLVRLSHRNVVSNALQIVEALSIDSTERAVTSLPLYYSYGLSVVNSHLAAGASVVLTGETLLSNTFWTVFRRAGCTSLAAVPYMYQMLQRLDLNALNVPTLKTMTQAGGRLPDQLVAKFHRAMVDRRGRFFVMYGQTEATARIAVLPPDALPGKLGSVGKAIPGGFLGIEADNQAVIVAHREGELVYRGPNVMSGYATCQEHLARGPELNGTLRTGDLGYFDNDGFFYITGRNDRFTKLVGLRINLDEVETMLKVNGPTAVLGGPDRLFIYCEYGDDEEFRNHARALGDKLNLHPGLFAFRRIDRMPLSSNGKTDYKTLARHDL